MVMAPITCPMKVTVDNSFTAYVNGEEVGSGDTWTTTYNFHFSASCDNGPTAQCTPQTTLAFDRYLHWTNDNRRTTNDNSRVDHLLPTEAHACRHRAGGNGNVYAIHGVDAGGERCRVCPSPARPPPTPQLLRISCGRPQPCC